MQKQNAALHATSLQLTHFKIGKYRYATVKCWSCNHPL